MKAWPAAYARCTVGLETPISGKMEHEKGVRLNPGFGRGKEVCTEEAGVTFLYVNFQSTAVYPAETPRIRFFFYVVDHFGETQFYFCEKQFFTYG